MAQVRPQGFIFTADYKLHQRVWIIALEQWGVILSIYVDTMGMQYNVRYFYNGEPRTVYMFPNELAEAKP